MIHTNTKMANDTNPNLSVTRGKEKVQISHITWHVKVSYLIVCEGPSSLDKWWLIQCMWCQAQPLPAMRTRWMSHTLVIWFPFDGRKIRTTQQRGRRTGAAQTATNSKIGKHDSKDLQMIFIVVINGVKIAKDIELTMNQRTVQPFDVVAEWIKKQYFIAGDGYR